MITYILIGNEFDLDKKNWHTFERGKYSVILSLKISLMIYKEQIYSITFNSRMTLHIYAT